MDPAEADYFDIYQNNKNKRYTQTPVVPKTNNPDYAPSLTEIPLFKPKTKPSSSSSYRQEELGNKFYMPKNSPANKKANLVSSPIEQENRPFMLVSTNIPKNKTQSLSFVEDNIIIDTPAMHRATMKKYNIAGRWYQPRTANIGDIFQGVASWYGPNFHGKKTSNGETYDMHKLTAAHKTLPMNTVVQVTNLKNNKSIQIRINDRGPFVKNRIIDLSFASAQALDVYDHGTTEVKVEILGFNAQVNQPHQKQSTGANNWLFSSSQNKQVALEKIKLQIGAYSSLQKAQNIAKTYATPRYASKVYKHFSHSSGQTIYKVVLQNFQSESEAKDFQEDRNLKDSFILSE